MSLRPSERTEVRRNRYKVAVDADDGRRRRENNMIEIGKSKREESLQKKRREGMPSQNSILSLHSSVIEKKLETLPAMVAGVYTDDNNMQLEATTQFRKLLSIERSPLIDEVIQAGVVPRLVEFLMRSDFPQLQFEAAWALTNIAFGTSENTKVVIDHGAVPIFVQLLQAMSDDVREQTRSSLPALERLIHSSDEEVLTNACWELSYLSDGTNDKIQAVIESGVCNRLVELLMYPSPSVLIPALSTVGNIVTGDDTQTRSMAEKSVLSPEGPSASDDEIRDLEVSRAQNNKKRLRKDSDAGKKRGVCYLSRIPPHMDPTRLRQILSQYGDIHRIYLVPENPTVQVQLKQAGGFRGKQFSEGWVEFTRISVAKKVANMLNGEQIGGKRRSSFYYDIWNIKYLNKFKWDDLTTETANNNRTREQKLTMEISAAKRERDFYLKKVDQSKALKFMKERMNKKQKTRGGELSGESEHVEEVKVIRRFPQNRPVADWAVQSKPGLSKDILKEVFGSS